MDFLSDLFNLSATSLFVSAFFSLEYSKSNAIIKETNRTSQDSIIIVYTYDSLPLMSEKKFNNFSFIFRNSEIFNIIKNTFF